MILSKGSIFIFNMPFQIHLNLVEPNLDHKLDLVLNKNP